MGWTFFWLTMFLGGLWGVLVTFSDKIERDMCYPLYRSVAMGGRRSILQFLLYSTLFSCLLRFLTRLPVWIACYYTIQYLDYSESAALKTVAVFVFATGLSRAADLVKDFYPTKREHDTFTKYMHRK